MGPWRRHQATLWRPRPAAPGHQAPALSADESLPRKFSLIHSEQPSCRLRGTPLMEHLRMIDQDQYNSDRVDSLSSKQSQNFSPPCVFIAFSRLAAAVSWEQLRQGSALSNRYLDSTTAEECATIKKRTRARG